MSKIYDFKVKSIDNVESDLSEYKGKVLLIVNTASNCGFSYQYEGLEKLYKTYKDRGLVVLGFPCNQFNQQEPGNEAEIKQFCKLKYDVSFPLFSKIEVKGENIHPLFDYLTNQKKGIFGSKDVKWNFTKFLIDKNGTVVKRFAPTIKPEKIVMDIEKLL
jgi:glutathione peroxidase